MKKTKSQGQLLEELRIWSGLSQKDFATKIDKSRTWLQVNVEKEKLFRTSIGPICKAFNIPAEYFEGQYLLPKTVDYQTNAGEPEIEYGKQIRELKVENESLRKELMQARNKIIDLQEKIIKLTGN